MRKRTYRYGITKDSHGNITSIEILQPKTKDIVIDRNDCIKIEK